MDTKPIPGISAQKINDFLKNSGITDSSSEEDFKELFTHQLEKYLKGEVSGIFISSLATQIYFEIFSTKIKDRDFESILLSTTDLSWYMHSNEHVKRIDKAVDDFISASESQ